jgi:hypothetical protein
MKSEDARARFDKLQAKTEEIYELLIGDGRDLKGVIPHLNEINGTVKWHTKVLWCVSGGAGMFLFWLIQQRFLG